MNTATTPQSIQDPRDIIQDERSAFFVCDWVQFALIHYEVDAEILQKAVPFKLDFFDGKAYVSCVAFTLENFQFVKNSLMQRLAMMPVCNHRYFNVRTYVKGGDQKGIYFLKEWISNRLCSMIGSQLYGLPCAPGQLDYQHDYSTGELTGEVTPNHQMETFQYQCSKKIGQDIRAIESGTLEEFLFERYVAFTEKNGCKRCFRIGHEPWRQTTLDIDEIEDHLMPTLGPWAKAMKLVKAHYSPGVHDVWMGKSFKLG